MSASKIARLELESAFVRYLTERKPDITGYQIVRAIANNLTKVDVAVNGITIENIPRIFDRLIMEEILIFADWKTPVFRAGKTVALVGNIFTSFKRGEEYVAVPTAVAKKRFLVVHGIHLKNEYTSLTYKGLYREVYELFKSRNIIHENHSRLMQIRRDVWEFVPENLRHTFMSVSTDGGLYFYEGDSDWPVEFFVSLREMRGEL